MGRLSPVVFAEQANEFLEAARREFGQRGVGISFPGYFLVSRALELAFKSFLLLKGQSEAQLRRVGHDLERSLSDARTHGLDEVIKLAPEHEAAVRMVNVYYLAKDLEYPTTGYKSYPEARYLLDCATQLLDRLHPHLRRWRPAT